MAQLSQLRSVDLSDASILMPNLGEIIANLTKVKEVNLYGVAINSTIPQLLTNLSSLTPLEVLDLSYCSFSGRLPDLLPHLESLRDFSIRYGNFHGMIPSWVWNITEVMDLGGNNFNGELPSTVNIGSLSTLTAIYLDSNLLSGMLSSWLFNLPLLQVLYLQGNQFSRLLILILRSNNFHGRLRTSQEKQQPFPKLQILDLSDNSFGGVFPSRLLKGFKAMMEDDENDDAMRYIGEYVDYSTEAHGTKEIIHGETSIWYSIALTFKSIDQEINGISTTLVAIDLSSNRFRGAIPKSIGELVLVRFLNLSHNNFTGSIPPSFENLNVIESLDLSSNQLTGQIPRELVNLHFLEIFSVANNKLNEAIPHGEYISGYLDASIQNLIAFTFKGIDHKLNEVSTTLAAINLSDNRFRGAIPKSIEELVLV
ncbi:hypothetical protein Nepgr_007635 [Nepenthes gracilis]|uniref:Uncharacterized protein n=1 Tax=Nepenthes gracilis TaxID=150966 RepID=A0AAD3S7D0_NEPGR|nr:hypothetical protein Nepgr_007635 [Nepenthes gracilis]